MLLFFWILLIFAFTSQIRCIMIKLKHYLSPECEFEEAYLRELLCDSYDSGIDDIVYEDVDWTVNP